MTEHYSGNDPGTGCALMILSAAITCAIFGVVAAIFLSGVV